MTQNEFKKEFAVFIMSHKRANDVKTVKCLETGNYTGDWYIVIDDEDPDADIYFEKYGKRVLQFCKMDEFKETDVGDLSDDRRCGVFARNAIQKFAKALGYSVHLQLDDDFDVISYRYIKNDRLVSKKCTDLDSVFYAMADYLTSTSITNLSFGLSSYYLGGADSRNFKDGMIPKTMGSFMLKASDPVKFIMHMNDDIATSSHAWSQGRMFFTVMACQVNTPETQAQSGGMTDIYKDNGTYRKSFYSVMLNPSFVKIGQQGRKYFRIHHHISWDNCCPKILGEKWKKSITT